MSKKNIWKGCNCKVTSCALFDTFEADECATCSNSFKNIRRAKCAKKKAEHAPLKKACSLLKATLPNMICDSLKAEISEFLKEVKCN